MNIKERLLNEIEKIDKENSIPFLRNDVNEILLCFKYNDGKRHYIFPSENMKIFREFIDDMIRLSKDGFYQARENYKKQIITPLINEKDMEIE